MTVPLDEDIVAAFAQGDEKAFQKIYRYYKEKLTFFALKFVKCPDLANDIVQEVFIAVLESKFKFINLVAFQSYLFKVTKNKIIDHFRKISSDNKLKEKIWLTIVEEQASAETIIIDSEYQTCLQQALEKLPPQKKLIYELSKVENYSYKEIAEYLGLSKNTVRNHMAETRLILKNYLLASAEIVLMVCFVLYLLF